MVQNKKNGAIIYSIFVLVGVLLYVNYMTEIVKLLNKTDSKWYAHCVLMACSMFFFTFVDSKASLTEKLLCIVYTLIVQAVMCVEYFLSITALQYVIIVLSMGFAVFSVVKYAKCKSVTFVTKAQLKNNLDGLLKGITNYNVVANGIFCVAILALLVNSMVSAIAIGVSVLVLAVALTAFKQSYSNKFYHKAKLLYVLEYLYIVYGISVTSIVPVSSNIGKYTLGVFIMYTIVLLTAYLVFERIYIMQTIESIIKSNTNTRTE